MEEQKLLKRKKKAISEYNRDLLISTCTKLSELYYKEEKYDLAAKEYEFLANKYKELKKSMDYARCNRMIGEAYTYLTQYNKALKYQEIYLRIAIEERDKLEEQRALATIGHTYLTSYLDKNDKNALVLAEKSFKKSLVVCEKLTGINQLEHMDMTARLFANMGRVQECLGHYAKAIELGQKSADICKVYDIWEQLERSYALLGSIYANKGDYGNGIQNYNLAIEVAGRLENKIPLICAGLVSKAEILIKMSDFSSAKNILLRAYKLKSPRQVDVEGIEHTLKVVAVMCYTEDRLLTINSNDHKTKKELYEKMGDGACDLRNYPKAIEYYHKMLQAAKDAGEPEERMSSCYNSLAQTYFDNDEYEKALEFYQKDYNISTNNVKDKITLLFNIADTMDLTGRDVDDIEEIFEKARNLCRNDERQLEGRVVSKYVKFLEKMNLMSKAKKLEEDLLNFSDTESEDPDIQNTPNIGEEINIDDITDISDNENDSVKPKPRRSKPLVMKRNIKGETSLHTACIKNELTLFKQLLEHDHPVNVRDYSGWLPIHEASNHGRLEMVKMLVEHGAAINDRGGSDCGGITPLHDAAINGHLEIVEYLLDKGASVITKTDTGQTPLYMLQNYRKNAADVDPVRASYCQSLINRMNETLKTLGHDKDVAVRNTVINTALVSEVNNSVFKGRKRGCTSYVVSSDEEDIEADTQRFPEVSSNSNSVTSHCATEQYQQVMSNLRKRNLDCDYSDRPSKKSAKKTPLLTTGEVDAGGDNWLEDDLRRSKKPKNFDGAYTNTLNIKNRSESANTNRYTMKTQQCPSKFSDYNIVDRDLKENQKPTKTKKRTYQTSLVNSGFVTERIPSPINVVQSHTQQSLRKSQTKLTNFMDERNVTEPDSTTVSPTVQRRISDSRPTHESNDVLLVDVKIIDKLYRVPIPYSARNTLTIKWLIDEAAKRYCRKEYVKPVLELETKNGAILAEDDYVTILFPLGVTQAEEVIAKVLRWDIPPLIDRYKEACNVLNIDENPMLSQSLQETLTILDLSNRNLRCQTLKPLFKAMNRQANFYHINLSGNLITTESIELLCSALPSLENLTSLNLSMNFVNSECLSRLANAFTQFDKNILENLVELNLSYNPLGNDSFKHLAVITRHLKLRSLKLIDVDFTSNLFNDNSNRHIELYLDYLEELDISENKMDKDDILKFIFWLRPSSVQILNISNNNVTNSGLVVEIVNIFESNNAMLNWKFKSLNFSRCMISDAEIYELTRLLSKAEQPIILNLSYNEDLTAISLRRLLQNDVAIQSLQLEGCPSILQYFEANSDVAWSLNEKNTIRRLLLSVDKQINKIEFEVLSRMWRTKHHEESCVITNLDNFLELSIC